MAWMPGVKHVPLQNFTADGMDAYDGVVLHIMEGTLEGSQSWFNNPTSQASSHFGVGKSGEIRQWVDTKDRAWAEMAGNRRWISIEHEGHSGDSLTPAQLASTASIVKWCHDTHGIPLQISDSPDTKGLGWHGMGGNPWGGHFNCPGDPIKNQRQEILAHAQGAQDMPLSKDDLNAIAGVVKSSDVRDTLTFAQFWWLHRALTGEIPASATPAMKAEAAALKAAFTTLVQDAVKGLAAGVDEEALARAVVKDIGTSLANG